MELLATSARLRRYTRQQRRWSENFLFRTNERAFYRIIQGNRESASTDEEDVVPDRGKTEAFWSTTDCFFVAIYWSPWPFFLNILLGKFDRH